MHKILIVFAQQDVKMVHLVTILQENVKQIV